MRQSAYRRLGYCMGLFGALVRQQRMISCAESPQGLARLLCAALAQRESQMSPPALARTQCTCVANGRDAMGYRSPSHITMIDGRTPASLKMESSLWSQSSPLFTLCTL